MAKIFGNAQVTDNAKVTDSAAVSDRAVVCGRARVSGNARILGNTQVHGDARVHGDVVLFHGNVGQDADVFKNGHVIAIEGMFADTVTVYRTVGGGHRVQAGCQNFQLTDDLTNIADRFGWKLPLGWEHVRAGLLLMVERWRNDTTTG